MTTLSKDEALGLLEEFSEFTSGMDDEVDGKVKQLREFIVDKFGEAGVYSFQELKTVAPAGVYSTVDGVSSSRLVVLKYRGRHSMETVVLWVDKSSSIVEPAEPGSWDNTLFKLMEGEIFTGRINSRDTEEDGVATQEQNPINQYNGGIAENTESGGTNSRWVIDGT